MKDAVERAKSLLPTGPGLSHCADWPPRFLKPAAAIAGVRLCVRCQEAEDKDQAQFAGYNRRGSKDSQLR